MELQKKDKIQLGITAILIIVLLFFVVKNFWGGKRSKAASIAQVQPMTPKVTEKRISFEELEEEARNLEFGRDPFSKQQVISVSRSSYVNLSGIAWDEEFPTAIINGQIVGVGDEIGGYRVIEIRRNKVVLTDGLKDVELKLEIE